MVVIARVDSARVVVFAFADVVVTAVLDRLKAALAIHTRVRCAQIVVVAVVGVKAAIRYRVVRALVVVWVARVHGATILVKAILVAGTAVWNRCVVAASV
jgi:hypothetical protein